MRYLLLFFSIVSFGVCFEPVAGLGFVLEHRPSCETSLAAPPRGGVAPDHGGPAPIPFAEIYAVSRASVLAVHAIAAGKPLEI